MQAKPFHSTLAEQDKVADVLWQHKITPTQQRVEIARVLLTHYQHMSAEEILDSVNANSAHVSKATVYNTLRLFAQKGLVREVIVDPSKVFYDSNVGPHHHFYNLDSGQLIDIDNSKLELPKLPELPPGTHAAGVDIIIRIRGEKSVRGD